MSGPLRKILAPIDGGERPLPMPLVRPPLPLVHVGAGPRTGVKSTPVRKYKSVLIKPEDCVINTLKIVITVIIGSGIF